MGRTGVMVCGHGSRDEAACAEFRRLVGRLAAALPEWPVEMGYLEFARPVIRDGLDALRARGVGEVLAVPGMLFAAGHVKNDVPSVLNAYAAEHGISVRMGRDLGIDPKLLQAARERVGAALERAESDVPPDETCLVVVGRGTSDSDANGNVAKVARMLWEGLGGVAHCEVGYSGVAHPRTEVAVERAARLGYRRVVVFPYFLFTGVLVRRIVDAVAAVAARYPGVEFVTAHYLDDHPLVVETFAERVRGILAGDVGMNCSLCKYRVQIVGHEASLGAPQESHHHHVEGVGTDGDGHGRHHGHGHDHHHGHGHDHGHHHAHGNGSGTGHAHHHDGDGHSHTHAHAEAHGHGPGRRANGAG